MSLSSSEQVCSIGRQSLLGFGDAVNLAIIVILHFIWNIRKRKNVNGIEFNFVSPTNICQLYLPFSFTHRSKTYPSTLRSQMLSILNPLYIYWRIIYTSRPNEIVICASYVSPTFCNLMALFPTVGWRNGCTTHCNNSIFLNLFIYEEYQQLKARVMTIVITEGQL